MKCDYQRQQLSENFVSPKAHGVIRRKHCRTEAGAVSAFHVLMSSDERHMAVCGWPVINEQKGHSLTLFDAILSQLVLFEILEKNED